MARVMLNDAELDALNGLPLASRVLYVEGIKPYMDYATGVVGTANSPSKSISLQSLAEVLYVEPKQGRTDTGSRSRKQARVCIDMLVEAGLIVSSSIATKQQKRLILKCVLADTDLSVQKKQGTNRAHYQGANRAQPEANENGYLDDSDTPKQGTPETPKQGTPPLTVKDTHSNTRASRKKDLIPEDFSIDEQVKILLKLSGVELERAEFMLVEFVSANISSGHLSLNWPHEFVVFIRRFGWRYDAHKKNRHLAAVPDARNGFSDKDYSKGTNGFVKWGVDDENS